MKNFWRVTARAFEGVDAVFLALVADHAGSSPGTRGAALGFVPGVAPWGTIGGGRMEAELLAEAAAPKEIGTFTLRTLIHRRTTSQGVPSGLICAGEQTVIAGWLGARERESIGRAAAAEEQDCDAVLAVTPRGLTFEARSDVENTLECNDDGFLYRIQLRAPRRVAIVGGGHCGFALSKTLSDLGYFVTLFDVDEARHTFRACESADRKVVLNSYAELAVQLPEKTRVVVMTSDLVSDVEALGALDTHRFPYVGVMGSRAKLAEIERRLAADGKHHVFARCRAPAGLPMKSNTPAEIAISIAAELLQLDN